MRFIKESEVRSWSPELRKSQAGLIKEASEQLEPHVFLSHSHLDRMLLSGVIRLFNVNKAPAYVDYQDDALPAVTSSATADGLRKKIDACARVVVATSGNLRESRWVPWEVGYGDGSKGLAKVALLALEADDGTIGIGQEYLGLYPSILIERKHGEFEVFVKDPRDKLLWKFEEWLFDDID